MYKAPLAAALLLWCAGAPCQNLPDRVVLPAPTGPYQVGREPFDWTDDARLDPFAPESGTRRSLTGYIWYPAVPANAPRAEYVPQPIRAALLQHANPAAASLARQYSVDQANVSSHAVERAPLAGGTARLPVLLMKPGRGGLILQYASLAEDLASHGYIVAGSDSPYTSPVVVQDRGSRFRGRLDLARVGAFGHSMGGAAALQFCRQERRCNAVVNIDGALWGDVATAGLKSPALFIFSDRPMLDRGNATNAANPLMRAIDHVRAGLPNQPSLIVIRGTRHYNFADSALLNDLTFARDMDMLGLIAPERGIELSRALLRGFFDRYLKRTAGKFPPAAPELRTE